ncbi:MAG: hypothetical protein ACM30I_01255 [Gemmatimonas sp.]
MTDSKWQPPERWLAPDGEPLACRDKIKVLNENLVELRAMAQDALEDAVLMGGDETQVRAVLAEMVASLVNPYGKK